MGCAERGEFHEPGLFNSSSNDDTHETTTTTTNDNNHNNFSLGSFVSQECYILLHNLCRSVYIYIYTHVCMCVYIYIYMCFAESCGDRHFPFAKRPTT